MLGVILKGYYFRGLLKNVKFWMCEEFEFPYNITSF